MPIIGKKIPLTPKNVENAPDEPGVYALYIGGHLVYYGYAETSIRDDLRDHRSGGKSKCTAAATIYDCEICLRPPNRQRDLLAEYKKAYGILPLCNGKMA
ncbi:MAG: hypothetical protein HQ494_12375 [Rhodospirillales bacterium]|nr:hypothetical protein [Rhodospirillales bacterium]